MICPIKIAENGSLRVNINVIGRNETGRKKSNTNFPNPSSPIPLSVQYSKLYTVPDNTYIKVITSEIYLLDIFLPLFITFLIGHLTIIQLTIKIIPCIIKDLYFTLHPDP